MYGIVILSLWFTFVSHSILLLAYIHFYERLVQKGIKFKFYKWTSISNLISNDNVNWSTAYKANEHSMHQHRHFKQRKSTHTNTFIIWSRYRKGNGRENNKRFCWRKYTQERKKKKQMHCEYQNRGNKNQNARQKL